MSITKNFMTTDDKKTLTLKEENAELEKQKELKSMLTALEETEEENAELEEQEEMESMLAALEDIEEEE